MPYKDDEKRKESDKERARRYRERHTQASPPPAVTPAVTPGTGIDGWHTTEDGRRYILQRSFGGLVRRYGPGGPDFSYYDPLVNEELPKGTGLTKYLRQDPTRLVRLQRIAGSLASYKKSQAFHGQNPLEMVWFGIGGPTMAEIGRVLGTQEPLITVR